MEILRTIEKTSEGSALIHYDFKVPSGVGRAFNGYLKMESPTFVTNLTRSSFSVRHAPVDLRIVSTVASGGKELGRIAKGCCGVVDPAGEGAWTERMDHALASLAHRATGTGGTKALVLIDTPPNGEQLPAMLYMHEHMGHRVRARDPLILVPSVQSRVIFGDSGVCRLESAPEAWERMYKHFDYVTPPREPAELGRVEGFMEVLIGSCVSSGHMEIKLDLPTGYEVHDASLYCASPGIHANTVTTGRGLHGIRLRVDANRQCMLDVVACGPGDAAGATGAIDRRGLKRFLQLVVDATSDTERAGSAGWTMDSAECKAEMGTLLASDKGLAHIWKLARRRATHHDSSSFEQPVMRQQSWGMPGEL